MRSCDWKPGNEWRNSGRKWQHSTTLIIISFFVVVIISFFVVVIIGIMMTIISHVVDLRN